MKFTDPVVSWAHYLCFNMSGKPERVLFRYHSMKCLSWIFVLWYTLPGNAQIDTVREFRTMIEGMPATIQIRGTDTIIISELNATGILPLVFFENPVEQERYLKYRRYALVVYPYAAHSVRLYRQVAKATEGLDEKSRRKFVDQIDQALEEQFENTLKNLTRTQGLILTKMIERELDKSFHSVVKELRGGFTAFYYNQLGKFNGYKLKEKYKPGTDQVLDAVLEEFDMKKDLNNDAP